MKEYYVNLYRSGHFHRANKPGQFNVHPGDLYPTWEAAIADIDHSGVYFATVVVVVSDTTAKGMGPVNPADSEPIPLEDTRAIRKEWGVGAMLDYIRDHTEHTASERKRPYAGQIGENE